MSDNLIGVTNLTLKPDKKTFHIVNIQNLYEPQHTRQSKQLSHLATWRQKDIEWEYRYEVNKEPSSQIAFGNFFEFKNDLLFFDVSEALEPRQKEVQVEEGFNDPVRHDDGILLLKIKGVVEDRVDAGVSNQH